MKTIRILLRTLTTLAIAAALLTPAGAAAKKPNILLVMVDDMG